MSTSAIAGSWATLPASLTPWVLDVIQSMGHTQMTPVQASTIPLFMHHKDVVVEAVTGSGKTLAFVIPIIERLVRREHKLRKNEIGALVISPTRELATQIHSVFSLFLSSQPAPLEPNTPLEADPSSADHSLATLPVPEYPPALLLVSSDKCTTSQDILRFSATGSDIVVGTPGRVEEFLLGKGKGVVSVKELEVLVLDEADRLLDLGFQASLTRIMNHLPKQRRTGLFSATMTDADALSELVRVSLRNPARIVVKVQSKKLTSVGSGLPEVIEERRIPANLQNYYLSCQASEKVVQLTRIIAHEVAEQHSSRFIVYFATCACVDYFYRILSPLLPKSTNLFSLHGHLPPAARTRSLSAFSSSFSTSSTSSILLATDLAARGLDLPHVDVVVQFDPPIDPKAFSHRCGRTARAGRAGRAWVLLVGRETEYVDFMAVRKIPLKERPYFNPDGSGFIPENEAGRPLDSTVSSYLTRIRDTVLKDRALHDKAVKSFVSFVRAYSKHEASYIFRIRDLDLIGVATSFGLLRLPKMPELAGRSRDGWNDAELDWSDFAYADKAQEAKRISAQGIAAAAASEKKRRDASARRAEKQSANAPWSTQVARKEARDLRKEKKERKRKWLKTQIDEKVENTGVESDGDDWDELACEERMAKKLRRGQISQGTFDEEFADL